MPSAKRPGAAWHIAATVWASVAAPRVHAHVGGDPAGPVVVAGDPDRVVEAVAARLASERLPDPERHVVADDSQHGGSHLRLGEPHPQRAAAVLGRTAAFAVRAG